MAVTRLTYAQELERRLAKGQSFEKAHAGAIKAGVVKKTTVKSTKRKRPERDEKIVKRVARKLYEVFRGPKAYAGKKFTPSKRIRR